MTTQSKISIAMVDDHRLLLDTLSAAINKFDSMRVTFNCINAKDFIAWLKEGNPPPDILLTDINMPDMDGYKLISWVHDHYPKVKIVVLTMYESEIAFIRLLKEGVKGFLRKDIHPAELRRALLSVHEQGCYYCNITTARLARVLHPSQGKSSGIDKAFLTDKEMKFLELSATELPYKAIAMNMEITERMVDNIRDNLFLRLGIKSRVGLALYAVRNGLISWN